jgi:hypothetical protein
MNFSVTSEKKKPIFIGAKNLAKKLAKKGPKKGPKKGQKFPQKFRKNAFAYIYNIICYCKAYTSSISSGFCGLPTASEASKKSFNSPFSIPQSTSSPQSSSIPQAFVI